ncbi:MAG TPA: hypothetical protein VK364_13810, partial [Hymenobacter sp.]|nr:hypothetical protein [Hymenobacter sp.]
MKYLNGIIFFGFYKLMSQTENMGLISWRAAALTCQFQVLVLLNFIIFAERKFDLNFISGNIYYYASGIVFTSINLHYIFHNSN